ncbi:spore cortex biosynthesis protein YabQ [Bacillus luteolus]|uniref:Spore cortex biosynthesis protein YabQ n=1 Tax=Litchfieldia luteola TaxID=682179 RepID=A0ABR9QDV8_9BACI|nr:spore cortex biosynthesis protein YabQ [Cytobacillus luteolus]MBE4906675.1 spore cortex biosynthesis protein YabQ [Cytobacillus luteolus]MBP1944408.1 spore cortex biosynthesis protein YabQ [Cytobacillus luteolus]
MSLTTQFYTMIAMIGMGSYLGAALDTYGRFLKRPKRARWLVFINDILFWVLQGLIIFYILLSVNEGELRFYVFLALLCGFAAYQSLLRTGYQRLLEVLIRAALRTYHFLEKTFHLFIVRPIQLFIQLIIVLLMGLLNILIAIGKILLNIFTVLVKVLLSPFKWIGVLLWRMLPQNLKKFLLKYFTSFAGIRKHAKNMKHMIIKWWNKIRKS